MGPVTNAWRRYLSGQYFTDLTDAERRNHAIEKIVDLEAIVRVGTQDHLAQDIRGAIIIIKEFLANDCTTRINWKQEGF